MKILVAEDNAVTATLMTGILTRHGYTVVLARNGTEAVKLLRSDPEIEGVITDIMMPESSGLDLLRVLRGHEAWKNLPTIVTTVRDDRETVAEAVSLGCQEYILKPVRPARLIERVTKVFRPDKVVLMSSPEVINRYSLSPETYRRIAKKFAAQVDGTLAELQDWGGNDAGAPPVDFIQIMEGATLLGAERLVAGLEKISAPAAPLRLNPFQVATIEEELLLVRKALRSQTG